MAPVPIAVLLPPAGDRHVPAPLDGGDPSGLTQPTAARLVGIYTDPGDLVVDIGGTGVLAVAAAQAGRPVTTMVTERDHAQQVQGTVEAHLDPTRRGLARTVAVPTAEVPDLLSGSGGRVRLLLTRLPVAGHRLGLRTASRWLSTCHTALTDQGHLVVAVDATGPSGRYVDHATTVIVAARAAGFLYHQHLVMVTRPLTEPASPDQVPSPLVHGGRPARVHADLFIFATHQTDTGGGDQRA